MIKKKKVIRHDPVFSGLKNLSVVCVREINKIKNPWWFKLAVKPHASDLAYIAEREPRDTLSAALFKAVIGYCDAARGNITETERRIIETFTTELFLQVQRTMETMEGVDE